MFIEDATWGKLHPQIISGGLYASNIQPNLGISQRHENVFLKD